MSAPGHLQTCPAQDGTSASPLKADIATTTWNVGYGPLADISPIQSHASASVTTRLGRNCQDGGVREIRIGHAVGRAARCSSLTLLVAGESTIARASIVVALQAIPILASCDRGYASCQDGHRRREGKK